MRFSVLHISDLHRDKNAEVPNGWLLDSLERDVEQFCLENDSVEHPALCIVSGDLIHGVAMSSEDPLGETARQYEQAEEFLVGLTDRLFKGNRDHVVILPGNHDVSLPLAAKSLQILDTPVERTERLKLVEEMNKTDSLVRWSWSDLCFLKIVNTELYDTRLQQFTETYESFYNKRRTYKLSPQDQWDVFDYPEYSFCVVALNSCFNNDPFRRSGAFHPETVTEACRALRNPIRAGWLAVASWHHNLSGGPQQTDYLDARFIQLLIDAGASIGFHGHQHISECFDERYCFGSNPRKMTIVSAGSLCAGPRSLKPSVPRSYNIVELDSNLMKGRVHQRQMINSQFELPIWGEGRFISTNRPSIEFELCKPIAYRPEGLDRQLLLEQADRLIGNRQWTEAVAVLVSLKDLPISRPLLRKALEELNEPRLTIQTLETPLNNIEAVLIGGAIIQAGSRTEAERFINSEFLRECKDASVLEVVRRVRERRLHG